jgi:hypothetical protein
VALSWAEVPFAKLEFARLISSEFTPEALFKIVVPPPQAVNSTASDAR